MRHVYDCPLRWADMDALGHVNNVVYVDYLQEARVDMLTVHAPQAGGEELGEGVVVARHEVDFVRPLAFRSAPVRIESWVTDVRAASFTMDYEIVDEHADGCRTVYARASTLLTPFVFAAERPRRIRPEERAVLERFREDDRAVQTAPWPDSANPARPYDCRVRWSDVDAYGHVNNVKYFEYVQEARIDLIRALAEDGLSGHSTWVVARQDIDYRRPVLFRPQPYRIDTRVVRIGRSSYHLQAEILDGDVPLARARTVVVAFDQATQRSRPMTETERAALEKAQAG